MILCCVCQVDQSPPPVSKKVGMTITIFSINGGFGFRIVGGRDISADIIPQVDLVAPGTVCCKLPLVYSPRAVSCLSSDACISLS